MSSAESINCTSMTRHTHLHSETLSNATVSSFLLPAERGLQHKAPPTDPVPRLCRRKVRQPITRGEFYRASGCYVGKVVPLRAASFALLVGYFSYALLNGLASFAT